MLVIEVDGKIHNNQKEYDQLRTKRLIELGYKVIRFTNFEVLNDIQTILSKIRSYLLK